MAGYKAETTVKRCPMHDPVCAGKVAEHMAALTPQPYTVDDAAADLERTCGRFTRGAHAGGLRGWASILVCTRGGWVRTGQSYGPGESQGYVARPGQVLGVAVTAYDGQVYCGAGDYHLMVGGR